MVTKNFSINIWLFFSKWLASPFRVTQSHRRKRFLRACFSINPYSCKNTYFYSPAPQARNFWIFTGHIQGIYIDFETSKALFGSFSDHACGFLHENRLIFTTTNNAFLKAFTVKSLKIFRLRRGFLKILYRNPILKKTILKFQISRK